MPPRRLHNALAPLLVAAIAGAMLSAQQREATPAWLDQAAPPAQRSTLANPDGSSIDITIKSNGGDPAVALIADTSQRALRVLIDWLGPPSAPAITIVDLPWGVGVPGASYPGAVATRMRWLRPEHDLTAERSLIGALARQFWFGTGDASFREALSIYSATRAIHAVLEGRDFAAPRYFGGFVAMPLRPLMLSPNIPGPGAPFDEFVEVLEPADAPWRFAPVVPGSRALRTAAALWTLERLIGWPAMQQVLAAVRGTAITPEAFAALASEQRGVGLDWFVRDLVRSDAPIDYAVGSVNSETAPDGVRTRVVIERRGAGVFSATDQPRAVAAARSLDAVVRFADGTEARSHVDGRDQRSEFSVASAAPATAVIIDPDQAVIVDADRSNNVWSPSPPRSPLGLRLIANWMIWLQNVMLTYTAIA